MQGSVGRRRQARWAAGREVTGRQTELGPFFRLCVPLGAGPSQAGGGSRPGGSGSYTQSEPESEKGGPVLRGVTWLQFRERTGWRLGVRSLRRGGAGRAEAGTEGLLWQAAEAGGRARLCGPPCP